MTATPDPLAALTVTRGLLEHSADRWTGILEIATGVVVLGVIIEAIATIFEVREELVGGKRPRLHHILTFIGSAIVIFSVAAEFVAEGIGQARQTSLRSNNEAAQVILTDRANNATKDAVELANNVGGLHSLVTSKVNDIDAAMKELEAHSDELMKARNEAMASAAGVENALAQAAKSRAELQSDVSKINDLQAQIHDLTAPRTIDILRLSVKLRGYKTPFVMEISNDSDAVSLATQLGEALELADWDWRPNKRSDNESEFGAPVLPGEPAVRELIASGVLIEYADKDQNSLELPANSLLDALTAEGIKNIHVVPLTDDDMKNHVDIYGVMHVVVGTRY